MRLVTFILDDCEKVGSLKGDRIVDLGAARVLKLLSQGSSVEKAVNTAREEIPDSMVRFIEGGKETLAVAGQAEAFVLSNEKLREAVHFVEDVKLKAPIPNPPMVWNMGNAYRPFPVYRFIAKPITSVIGPDDPIVIPREMLDELGPVYEIELGIIIGKRGKRIPNNETAYDYVYGYTIYNDVTDYGGQIEGKFPYTKMHDTFCPMGPCITTKDEIQDPYNLMKRVWVNGQLASERSTQEMVRKIPEFISVPSQTVTLVPGTVLSGGARDAGRIKPKDTVELEITNIGRLRNPVVAEE